MRCPLVARGGGWRGWHRFTGCNITGSGSVGELILIDGDLLDKTNMNRVRGYRAEDIGTIRRTA